MTPSKHNTFWLLVIVAILVLYFCASSCKEKPAISECSQIIKSDCEIVYDGEQYAIRRIKDKLFWSHDGLIWAKDMPILFRDSCQAKRQLLEWIEVNREFNKKRTFQPI